MKIQQIPENITVDVVRDSQRAVGTVRMLSSPSQPLPSLTVSVLSCPVLAHFFHPPVHVAHRRPGTLLGGRDQGRRKGERGGGGGRWLKGKRRAERWAGRRPC
eukprot:451390-Hanusia_phi.AAC.3